MSRWSVRKRDGAWRVYDRDVWWDTFDSLPEAHTEATQCAICDELWQPGGLTRFTNLLAIAKGMR